MSDQWYYGQNGQQKGPVSVEVMQQLIAGGHLKRDDLVWREGMANWVAAGSVGDLFPESAPTAPTSPVAPVQPAAPVPPSPGATVSYQPVDPQSAAALQSKATTALVLGICSIVPGSCCAPLGLGLGIAALIVGQNVKFGPSAGTAKAGFICGIVGIVLSVISCLPQSRFYFH